MELQLWLRLLVVGSLAAATNSAAGLTNTSSNTCPYDPTLAARWLRSHNYSWGRLTQCPQASWVERYTQLVNAGQVAGEAGPGVAGVAGVAASGPALIVGGNKGNNITNVRS